MNKTAIEWCDYTWNPVTGCLHGCTYCYARKIAERFKGSKAWPNGFEPMFHHERLTDPSKKKQPQTIFVCSVSDLFGAWVPDLWLRQIFNECVIGFNHNYIFLTKNPKRYLTMPCEYIRQNRWFGTTITNAYDVDQRLHWLKRLPLANTFVSFEPLHGDVGYMDLTGIKQVIIGAQTHPFYPVQVSWVKAIEDEADRVGAKVFVKDSLKEWMGDSSLFRRELAWPLVKT